MRLTVSMRHVTAALVGATSLTLALTGCGEKASESPASSGTSGVPSVAADQALAGKVPAGVRADGKLLVGSDSTYAPSEFLDTDGKTVIGFDVDLFNAVAAKLGLRTEWQSAAFTDVIPGVQSGKYEVGVSSLTINDERKKQVLMVSYFNAGTQWVARKGATIKPDDVCGKKIAVQKGTVQVDDITARSTKCTQAGKPAVAIDQYQAQSDVTTAIISGKNDAMLADSPVSAYAVKQSNGQLALVGDIYDSAPYGFIVNRDQQAFGEALRDATKALIADGTYRKILARWGVEGGSLGVDPAVAS